MNKPNNVTNLTQKRLLTVKEVSEMLGIGKSTIYAYASMGIIKSITLPMVRPSTATKRNKRAIRFRPEEIEGFLQGL